MEIQKLVRELGIAILLLFKCIILSTASDTIPVKKFETINREIIKTSMGVDTILTHKYGSKIITTKINCDTYIVTEDNSVYYYSKTTPRLILRRDKLHFNIIDKSIHGSIITKISNSAESYKTPSTYSYSGWSNKGHFIFDVYNNFLLYHSWNNITYKYRNSYGEFSGPIKNVDIMQICNLDSILNDRNELLKSDNSPRRNGYLTKAFQNRQNGDSMMGQKVTLTIDSLDVYDALNESWYDFHIDKKGRTHAFVYLRGELIYLRQDLPSLRSNTDTWEEIFSIPATDDIGPFTSVTVRGKQYLFTQDGTILESNGKTMKQSGKLPGGLKHTSIVWDKEADKMWYITREELDAYKAGDTSVIERMHKVPAKN